MATQFFRVVSKTGLRVRTKPEISASTLVRDRTLVFGDIVEVKSESRTEAANYVWWENASATGMWTASQQIKPLLTLMEDYQLPHDPTPPTTTPTDTTTGGTTSDTTTPSDTTTGGTTSGDTTTPSDMTSDGTAAGGTTTGDTTTGGTTDTTPATTPQTILFEVVADRLSIRSQPKLGNTLVNGQFLQRGQRLDFQPTSTKADGFIWWEQVNHPGWWSASGSLQGGQTYMNPIDQSVEQEGNTHLLTVPWVTQIQTTGVNFANDCGHTCVLMVMRYNGLGWNTTVSDLYRLPYKNNNGTTNNQQLPQIARDGSGKKLVLMPFVTKPATMEALQGLKTTLLNNKPVILLVWYPSLNFNNRANGPFNHWLVVTGFKGDTFYLNDPLWLTENQGAGRAIASTTLLKACQDTGQGLYGVS